MGAQTSMAEDDWELIPNDRPRTSVATRPKCNPLHRLVVPFAPRLAAQHQVSLDPSLVQSSTPVSAQGSGPRLTVDGITTAVPALANSYEPQRHRAPYSVTHSADHAPYGHVNRSSYRPTSLSYPASVQSLSPDAETPEVSTVSQVSPMNNFHRRLDADSLSSNPGAKPLPRPPQNLAPTSKRTSAMSLLRAKKTSDVSHLLSHFDELLIFALVRGAGM